MYFILRPLIITLAIYTMGIFTKRKMKTVVYIILFFTYLLFDIIFEQKAYGISIEKPSKSYFTESFSSNYTAFNAKIEIKHIKIALKCLLRAEANLTPEIKRDYEEKVQFHSVKGEECFKKAEEKCWYLPELDYQEKSALCFTTAFAILGPGDPKAKIALATLALLHGYGLHCIEEWHEIQSLLYEADYHYEMMRFYLDVLDIYGIAE